jgi:hypothetical protein
MTDIDLPALDRELKKGAAELLLLSVLEARPRHGYELGKLIETQSGGRLVFHLPRLALRRFADLIEKRRDALASRSRR